MRPRSEMVKYPTKVLAVQRRSDVSESSHLSDEGLGPGDGTQRRDYAGTDTGNITEHICALLQFRT